MFRIISLLQALMFCTLLSIAACADSPISAVNSPSANPILENEDHKEEDGVSTLAVKYEGKDTQGRQCDFFVAVSNDDSADTHGDPSHEHHYLMKVDYVTLDGHRLHASEGRFYLYNSQTGNYYEQSSNQPDTTLSMLSVNLKDPDAKVDVNFINDYLANGELEQYLRVEFAKNVDAEQFEHALIDVLAGTVPLNDKLNVFDNIQLISMGTAHGDHYHFPICLNYKAVGLEVTAFGAGDHE